MGPTPIADAPTPSVTARRSAARLAAVQALYQILMSNADVGTVLREFKSINRNDEPGQEPLVEPDPELFAAIVRGTADRRAEVDRLLAGAGSGDRPLERSEPVLRVIVYAGAWELLANPGVAARIILSEYVDLAHAFFDGREPAIVNALLDRLAHAVRPGEVGGSGDRG